MSYNRFYTKEKWETVNRYNKMLIADYMKETASRGLKKSTREQYFNDLRIIAIYILDNLDNRPFSELVKKDFRDLVLHFMEIGMSNARASRLMSVVRSMLSFAEDDDDWSDINTNHAGKIKGLSREPVREIIFLTDEEVMIIYNELIKDSRYKEALLCAILYESLGRRTEIAQLDYDDIALDRAKSNKLVIAKRGKQYRPVYSDLTKRAYSLYREQRGDDNRQQLWINKLGTGASSDNLYDWVIKWRKILEDITGKYREFNPHSLRHSGATNYENGTHNFCKKIGRALTLTEIQKIMNHSDISTTQSYLKNRDEEILDNIFNV